MPQGNQILECISEWMICNLLEISVNKQLILFPSFYVYACLVHAFIYT